MATLGNPKNTIEVLQKYHFNFQKKFGQNFLINTSILEEIIDAAEITREDFVLEIGPGIGTMTQYLCEAAREVVAVEIDTNLIPILGDTLSAYDNVEVMNADILKVDIAKLADERNGGKPIKVVANLPQPRLLWGFLKVMFQSTALQSWCRRKWQIVCRKDREARNMVRCRWLCSIMQSRRSLLMYRRAVLCHSRKWGVRSSG